MRLFVLSALAGLGLLANAATAATYTVAGDANPYLAGMPDGSGAGWGDSAPGQSPVEATGLSLVAGSVLQISATGWVSHTAKSSGPTPDGSGVYSHAGGAMNGISGITALLDSLLAVFLSDAQPNTVAAPDALNFSGAAARDYNTISPMLQQVFFVGDGLTSGGVQQEIVVPAGATRLFLATMDGYSWNNNTGAFSVTVTAPTGAVPLPATGLMLLTGIGAVGALRRRTRT